jgi:hypothetical protein
MPVRDTVPQTASFRPTFSDVKSNPDKPIKTVEFTITKEPKAEPAPIVNPTPASTASNHGEATEDIAILIGQRIARDNPAYQRSANDLKTYTKVVSGDDDELYRQLSGIMSTPKAEAEEPKVEELTYSEPAPVAEPTPEVLPDPVEFTFGESKSEAAEPDQKSSYQRAASFASAMFGETVEFRPYTPPTVASEPASEPTPEATIKVERELLPPTPEALVRETAPAPAPTPVAEPLFTVVDEGDEEDEDELDDGD